MERRSCHIAYNVGPWLVNNLTNSGPRPFEMLAFCCWSLHHWTRVFRQVDQQRGKNSFAWPMNSPSACSKARRRTVVRYPIPWNLRFVRRQGLNRTLCGSLCVCRANERTDRELAAGGRTGRIQVTTSGGIATSPTSFTVI